MDRNQLGQRLKAWLEEKHASKCPLCGEESWDFGHPRQVFLISARGGVQLTCDNCGHVVLLNAAKIFRATEEVEAEGLIEP